VFLAHADADPGVFYLHDAEKNKTVELFQNRPWINPEQMARMEPVTIKARDGLALHGYVTRPPGKGARALDRVVRSIGDDGGGCGRPVHRPPPAT